MRPNATAVVRTRAYELQSDDRVLDIGCGTGQTTRDAARLAQAVSAPGVDTSAPAMVYRFPQQHFDLAISRFGTTFFADPAAAFANIGWALRPAGRLVMMVWQAPSGTNGTSLFTNPSAVPADKGPLPPKGRIRSRSPSHPQSTGS